MSHKQQKNNKQPHLAVANMPFTPMTHKIEKPVSTPYRLLQVNDLATPKINKSHSSVEKIEMVNLQGEFQDHAEPQPESHLQEKPPIKTSHQTGKGSKGIKKNSNIDDSLSEKDYFLDDSANDLKDLKNALFACLQVVERMEIKEKEQMKKSYRNIQVQTSPLPPKISSKPQRKLSSNQLPENINSNSNSNDIISENYLKPPKHYNQNKGYNGKHNDDHDPSDSPEMNEKLKVMKNLIQKIQTKLDNSNNK